MKAEHYKKSIKELKGLLEKWNKSPPRKQDLARTFSKNKYYSQAETQIVTYPK